MADTTALKNRIRAAIKANDNQEITGPVLQQSLLDMVDELNGATETEASARQNGDSTLQQDISRLQEADTTLQQSINTEKQRAEGVEQSLSQNISQLQTAVSNLRNAGYAFGGIAVTGTNPGVPTGNCFYIVRGAGTYTHFKNADNESIVLENDGIYVLTYESVENNYWEYNLIISIDDRIIAGSNNLVKSNRIVDYISLNNGIIIPAVQNMPQYSYQASKIKNLRVAMNKEYEGCSIRIVQMGWVEHSKAFMLMVLCANSQGQVLNVAPIVNGNFNTGVVSYDSIPTENTHYKVVLVRMWDTRSPTVDFSDKPIYFAEIDFDYDWESVNGDISNHCVNNDVPEYLELMPHFYLTDNMNFPNFHGNGLGEMCYNASYEQSIHLKDVSIVASPKYAGYDFYIVQMGWNSSLSKFLFGIAISKDGQMYGTASPQGTTELTVDERQSVISHYACLYDSLGNDVAVCRYTYDHRDSENLTVLNVNPASGITIVKQRAIKITNVGVKSFNTLLNHFVFGNADSDIICSQIGLVEHSTLTSNMGISDPIYKVTASGAQSTKNALLKSIILNVNSAGTYKVGVGTIDSNDNVIIRDTFDIEVPSTTNANQIIDITNLNKDIRVGEYLWLWINAYNQGTNSHQIVLSSEVDNYVIVANKTSVIDRVRVVYITLAYEVVEIDSYFAPKTVAENVSILNNLVLGTQNYIRFGSLDYDNLTRVIGTSLTTLSYSTTKAKSNINGILKTITLNTTVAGTYKIGIGYIDQRGLVMMRETFDINVPLTTTMNQTIDVFNLGKEIHVDDYLWVWINAYDQDTNCHQYVSDSDLDNHIIGCDAAGYADFSFTKVYFSLAFDVYNTNSYFALKADVEELSEIVEPTDTLLFNGDSDIITQIGSSDFLADRTVGTTSNTVKYTAKKSRSNVDGILKTVTVNTTVAGTYKMGVGYIDQRGLVMMRETFDINVPLTTTENQTIDVQDKNIKIHVDDYVWMWINAYNQGTNCRNYGASDTSTVLDNYIIACGADEYIDESLKYVYFQLTYSVLENNSVFASKADVEEVNEIANTAMDNSTEALSKVGIVYDESNNPYKLKIVNNQLVYVSVYKQNVLVIGNSYSYHYTIASLGWYLTAGMAATRLENDFVHQLQGVLRTKINDAIATAYWNGTDSGYWIERQSNEEHTITDEEFATFFAANLVQKNWDAIVFEIQGNVSSSHTNRFITNISNCIDWIRNSQYASADIYMVVMDYDKREQILQLISEKKIGKVVIQSPRDNYMYLQQYGYYYWGDDTQEYPIISAGVKGHINDLGMLYLANQIAVAMGYDAAGKTHNISIGSSVDYLGPSIGVEGGLITILTYGSSAPTITVSSGGSSIQTTVHDMSNVQWIQQPSRLPTFATTFTMPNADVIISIS